MTEIFDQNGKIVLMKYEPEINISGLLPGVYIVKCIGTNNESFYSKLVKI